MNNRNRRPVWELVFAEANISADHNRSSRGIPEAEGL